MATILYNSEDIGDDVAACVNAAMAELYSYFRIFPKIKSPLGGKRTLAQAIALGTGARSDHYKGHGIDIDNQRQFRNINEAAFEYILAAHGLHNVQINGRPFPEEPWHFAIQNGCSSRLSSESLTEPEPITNNEESEDKIMLNQTALLRITDGQNIFKGGKNRRFYFLIDPSGWVRIASNPNNTSPLGDYWAARLGNVAAPDVFYEEIELAAKSAGHDAKDLFNPAIEFYRNPAA